MTDGISSRTCHTKLNFNFPYVRFFLLRRNTYALRYAKSIEETARADSLASDLFFYKTLTIFGLM